MASKTARTHVARDAARRHRRRGTRGRRAPEPFHLQLAELIRAARDAARLTQQALADRVGTTQPVIARLERADYAGHSLATLRRVAAALDLELELRFRAARPRRSSRRPTRRQAR